MKKTFHLVVLIALLAVALGIQGANEARAADPVRLFGTTGNGPSGGTGGTSTLVELDPATGALINTIGPVGYLVNGLDYDPVSGNLYATTSAQDTTFPVGLITIDMTTGAGTQVVALEDGGSGNGVTNVRADSAGTLYAWWENGDDLVTIDPVTGTLTVVGDSGISTSGYGMSFDATDTLYLVQYDIYTVDTTTGAATDTGLDTDLAHHGDFHPDTGMYWGIDIPGSGTKNLKVINLATGVVDATLPTVDNLHTVAFTGVFSGPTFADVPSTHWAYSFIESLADAGVTSGCGNGNFCPNELVTRAQMAVFLLRAEHGIGYTPPAATGTVFNDVPLGSFAAAWIEQLASEGITGGCGGGNFCPNQTISRAQVAVFLLRGEHGSGYTPPAATGTVFNDVPLGSFAAAWIEQLSSEGITSGCGNGNFCPAAPVSRAEMAVFLVRTFNLP